MSVSPSSKNKDAEFSKTENKNAAGDENSSKKSGLIKFSIVDLPKQRIRNNKTGSNKRPRSSVIDDEGKHVSSSIDALSKSSNLGKFNSVADSFEQEDELDRKRRAALEESERRRLYNEELVIPLPQSPKADEKKGKEEEEIAMTTTIPKPILTDQSSVQRPDELPVTSAAYMEVPVSEFGAAMLRGMGWKGSAPGNEDDGSSNTQRRHARLGLGAVAPLTDREVLREAEKKHHDNNSNPNQSVRSKILEQANKTTQRLKETEEERRRRLQARLQDGSVVLMKATTAANEKGHHEKTVRAVVVRAMGVPGLDKILVQCENKPEHMAIDRNSVVLEHVDRLKERPFRYFQTPLDKNRVIKKEEHSKEEEHERDNHYQQRYNGSTSDQRHRTKAHTRDQNGRDRIRDNPKAQRSSSSSSSTHNFIPSIRVRVISRHYGRHYYNEKGVIVEVLPSDRIMLKMDGDAKILDRVSARHLETFLPKLNTRTHDNNNNHNPDETRMTTVCLLRRDCRGMLGTLLEKKRVSDRKKRDDGRVVAVVHVTDTGQVQNFELDDVAQWCGDDFGDAML